MVTMKYFCFDTETGGLKKDFSLLTLYGEILDEDFNVQDEIDLKIKPDDGNYHVCVEALRTNKIDLLEHDKTAISTTDASNKFKSFICRHSVNNKIIPVGHNVSMDIKFVKTYLMESEEWEKHFSYQKMDSQAIAIFLSFSGLLPELPSHSLEMLAKYFKLNTESLHDAKIDVKTTRKIIMLMSDKLKNKESK